MTFYNATFANPGETCGELLATSVDTHGALRLPSEGWEHADGHQVLVLLECGFVRTSHVKAFRRRRPVPNIWDAPQLQKGNG